MLKKRLLERGKTGGREDDNEETITKRIEAFTKDTEPTLEMYRTFGKVYPVNALGTIDQVYAATKEALLPNLTFIFGPPVDDVCKLACFLKNRTCHKLINLRCFYKMNNLLNASSDK